MRVGIDLGTTYSLVSRVNHQGVPVVFPDAMNASLFHTASVVHVAGKYALVGQLVEELLEDAPDLPVSRRSKLLIGREETALTDLEGRAWSPEAIGALVLRKLIQDVKAFEDEPIEGGVVTVPAQFDDAQRRGVREALAMAGLGGFELHDEPVAASMYYGANLAKGEETLFVYDLGGGTFDATVVQVSPDGVHVLATEGSNRVGGIHIDERIVDQVAETVRRRFGSDPLADPHAALALRRFAEQVKLRMTQRAGGPVQRSLLVGGRGVEFALTRAHFEELARPLIDETLAVSKRCLEGAGLTWPMVDRVLLVGGASLSPLAEVALARASGKPREQLVRRQPHQAVALGAALLAGRSTREGLPSIEQRISSYELGIRTRHRRTGQLGFETLIARNAPLPARAEKTLYTSREDQTRVVLEILQRKGEEDEPRSLGVFAFGPIDRPHKNHPIRVELGYDIEGLVRVTAHDPESGKSFERVLSDKAMQVSARLAVQRDWIEGLPVNP